MNRTTTFTTRAPAAPAPPGEAAFQAPARLADLVHGIWAITPSMLAELQSIYDTHMRGEKINVAAVEARLGHQLENRQAGYSILRGGVAVLPIEGVIAPKANLFTQISGGASAQILAREMRAAGADPKVSAVIQLLDTPGGNVLGIPELAQAVLDVSAIKPVVSFTDGQMCSAGVWVGTAANHIFGSGSTVEVGSIGCLVTHRDVSGADEKDGVKVTHITAGKYKALGSPHQQLSKDARAEIQARVDYCYSLFVDAVAAHRGVDAETVLEHMADGRVFRGQQAMDAGLLDGFMSLDALIESLATDPAKYAKRAVSRFARKATTPTSGAGARADEPPTIVEGASSMGTENTTPAAPAAVTLESLQRDHSGVYAAVLALGATAERNRQAEVRAQLLPGHEALIEKLAGDGMTTGAQAAMAVLAAENTLRKNAQREHEEDAPTPVKGAAPAADQPGGNKTRQQQADDAEAYVAKNGGSISAAMKAMGYA